MEDRSQDTIASRNGQSLLFDLLLCPAPARLAAEKQSNRRGWNLLGNVRRGYKNCRPDDFADHGGEAALEKAAIAAYAPSFSKNKQIVSIPR